MAKRTRFGRDLPGMMYGFGDAEQPHQESVEVIDDLVTRYVQSLCQQARTIAAIRDSTIDANCFVLAVKSEPRKSRRVIVSSVASPLIIHSSQKLLEMRTTIKEARKIDYDDDDD